MYNDGSIDHRVGALTRKEYNQAIQPQYTDNPYADDPNNPFDASGTYPIGVHKIKWIVEDGCGNIGQCEMLFEILDCKAPTPYCLTGVITVPMPSSGCVTIWARDLDAGSFDNCTAQEDLKFYFDGDTSQRGKTICCDDFVNAGANDELFVEVEMWVEDEEGNTDFCKTTIIIQDNQDICPNTGSARIQGDAVTAIGNESTAHIDATVNGDNGYTMTYRDITKTFTFNLAVNHDYTVSLSRNDAPLNGVTTADILAIQKHILGIRELNNNYKMIAADVIEDQRITVRDISEIRKLILGKISNFSEVESWTFVPQGTQFVDVYDMNYDKEMTYNVVEEHPYVYRSDWMSVKMGDVTNDATAGLQSGAGTRTNGVLRLEIDEQELVAGQTYRVELMSSNYEAVAGYQYTIKYDESMMQYVGMESGAIELGESNFGTTHTGEGIITTSYDAREVESFDGDDVLYSLEFTALRNGKLSQAIAINSQLTKAEAYDADLNVSDVSLSVRTDNGVTETGVFSLDQNTPNPFSEETVITFSLPTAGPATLTIYNVGG